MNRLLTIAAPILAVLASSCSSVVQQEPLRASRVMYEWYDVGGPGKVKVKIDLSEQKATYTRAGQPIGWSYVATGVDGRRTPTGTFHVSEKVVDKYSNKYGWIEDELGNTVNDDATPGSRVPPGCTYMPAPMPYWMRLTDYGIGMHGGNIPNPGQTASHGCIRMPKTFVPQLFDVVDIGTPVQITP